MNNEYNIRRTAEQSVWHLDNYIESIRNMAYKVIQEILVKNPPTEPTIIDPYLILKEVFERAEDEILKQKIMHKQGVYIQSTRLDPTKPKKPN